MQALEEWLGIPLFVRSQRSLSLTAAGQRLLRPVQQAFEILSEATDKIPRLARFMERHPDIAVSLHTEGRGIDVPLAGTDLAIRLASAPKAGGTWLRLVREYHVPVCSPGLAARLEGGPADKMFQLAPLIHLPTVVEDWHWWFKQSGIQPPRGNQHLCFDTIRLAMIGAVQGLGIAIGRKPLVDDDIAAGRLVEIGGPPRQASTSYWLVGEEATFKRSEAKLFRRWLIDEMALK